MTIVAVKKGPLLVTVQRAIRGIEVQPDLFGRLLKDLQEKSYQPPPSTIQCILPNRWIIRPHP